MFLLLPLTVMLLSLNKTVLIVIGVPFLALTILVIIVNILQRKVPKMLPNILKDWEFLPLPLHSLEPYDRLITGWKCCRRCTQADVEVDSETTSISEVEMVERSSYGAVEELK